MSGPGLVLPSGKLGCASFAPLSLLPNRTLFLSLHPQFNILLHACVSSTPVPTQTPALGELLAN